MQVERGDGLRLVWAALIPAILSIFPNYITYVEI